MTLQVDDDSAKLEFEREMRTMKANFRRGGLFMLPAVILAIIIAFVVDAPISALISIGVFGFVTALILILLGDRKITKSK